MSLPLVLNTHSLPFADQESANVGAIEFINIFHRCSKYGYTILLKSDELDDDLMHVQLADQYYFQNWYNQAKQDEDLKDCTRKFRSIATRPLFEAVNHPPDTIEVGLAGEDNGSEIMLAVHHHKTYLCSFVSHDHWTEHLINCWFLDIEIETESEAEQSIDVKNLSNKESFSHYEAELIVSRSTSISTGREILDNHATFFSHLTFLDDQIGGVLRIWSHRMDILYAARDAMLVLNDFSQKWKNNEFVDYQHSYLRDLGLQAEVSGESRSVKNSRSKKAERMFWLEDGRNVFCENHVKLPSGFRLHFYPDTSNRRIILAYLGPHLTI